MEPCRTSSSRPSSTDSVSPTKVRRYGAQDSVTQLGATGSASAKAVKLNCQRTSVSVILPIYNLEPYLDDAFSSLLAQVHRPIEVSVWDDGSNDSSVVITEKWLAKLRTAGFTTVFGKKGLAAGPSGCGPAKNRAVTYV